MKSRLFREIQNLFKELGNTAMDALCPETIGDEVRTEELLWKAADLREKLNDKTIEALIRYQPLARDMRFIRAVLGSTYDTYRVVRHASRINVVLNISPDEKAEHVARDVFNLIRPWLNHGISAIGRDARIPVDDLPFLSLRSRNCGSISRKQMIQKLWPCSFMEREYPIIQNTF
ncbi:hypothetical protein JCM16138_00170 [Thermococcus atlanticus]